jgi:hypothetical protein
MAKTALVEGLLRPEAYPWRPAVVELVETHISWVFLAGDRVVKIKKPVDYRQPEPDRRKDGFNPSFPGCHSRRQVASPQLPIA